MHFNKKNKGFDRRFQTISQSARTIHSDHATLFWFRGGDESICNAIDLNRANSFHWFKPYKHAYHECSQANTWL